MAATFVVGDIHGQFMPLVRLLDAQGLIDQNGLVTGETVWTGGDANLWFLGDVFDRGPAGLATARLIMRLQKEAAQTGGAVEALLGNHEALILAAKRFPADIAYDTFTVLEVWQRNGGLAEDMAGFTASYASWVEQRPAMALVGNSLLVHADAMFYRQYGASIEEVNSALAGVLQSTDIAALNTLLYQFTERRAFAAPEYGVDVAAAFLERFGGQRIIHGHTPISILSGQSPAEVTAPYVYADALCVDVDAGMYLGSPGFIYQLPD